MEEEVKPRDEFEEEEAEVKKVKKSKPKKSCVICVGSTGTGKSTLIKIMTGANVETSSRADSVTKTSSVYSKKKGFLSQDKKPLQYWIDTQGWEDSDIEKQDNQIFKDIFQCLWDSEMTEISGIVWNINPNERATDTLQRQARLTLIIIESTLNHHSSKESFKIFGMIVKVRLIQRLSNKVENVWSRVVIICKKIHEPDLPFQVHKMVVMMVVMVVMMRIIALSSFVRRSMPFQVQR